MALSANTAFEVRSTGSDTACSGGFRAGASGTDYSTQDSAQASFTNLGCLNNSTTLTDNGNNNLFTTAMVGNLIQITSGSHFTTGFYEITSRTDANNVVLDRTPNSSGLTATVGVGAVGGALATPAKAAGAVVSGNKIFVKAATYTCTATNTFSTSTTPSNSQMPCRIIGYTTSRGDNGRATIKLSTNTGLTGLSMTGNGWMVENLAVDCNSLGTSTGIAIAEFSTVRNCLVKNFTSIGISLTNQQSLVDSCEVTAGTSAATGGIVVTSGISPVTIWACHVHDNSCTGIVARFFNVVASCLVVNNTGASSDGISSAYGTVLLNNTVHGSGRHGINGTSNNWIGPCWHNNVLTSNGGYGVVGCSSAGAPADPGWDGDFYQGNGSGARSNMDDTTTNAINNVAPYTNTFDQIGTASPYYATGDYHPGMASGGGTLVRRNGLPRTFPGYSGNSGFPDMGAIQAIPIFEHPGTCGGADG